MNNNIGKTQTVHCNPDPARTSEENTETRSFSPTTPFRCSALTLNGHRVHYDPVFAQETEGYKGTVVLGPLIAQVVMQMAASKGNLSFFLAQLRAADRRRTRRLLHF